MAKKSTMRGDRTRDQSIKSRTLYQTELARLDELSKNAEGECVYVGWLV